MAILGHNIHLFPSYEGLWGMEHLWHGKTCSLIRTRWVRGVYGGGVRCKTQVVARRDKVSYNM